MPSAIGVGKRGMVLGVQEVLAAVGYHTEHITKTAMRRALYKGANVFRDEARRRVSVRFGLLKRAIVSETRGENFLTGPNGKRVPVSHRLVVTIQKRAFTRNAKGKYKGVDRKKTHNREYIRGDIYPRNYAHLVEFGTKPHALGKGGQGGAMHPGSRPKPFMRPAFTSKKDAAVAAIVQHLRMEIVKEAQKSAAKAAKRRKSA